LFFCVIFQFLLSTRAAGYNWLCSPYTENTWKDPREMRVRIINDNLILKKQKSLPRNLPWQFIFVNYTSSIKSIVLSPVSREKKRDNINWSFKFCLYGPDKIFMINVPNDFIYWWSDKVSLMTINKPDKQNSFTDLTF
jgi:hypothetical protein